MRCAEVLVQQLEMDVSGTAHTNGPTVLVPGGMIVQWGGTKVLRNEPFPVPIFNCKSHVDYPGQNYSFCGKKRHGPRHGMAVESVVAGQQM